MPPGTRAAARATPRPGDDVHAVGRPRPPRSRSCSPGTWRSTRRWSTASTRTSAACSPRSTSSASSTTRSSCSLSDNGASREGEAVGTTAYFRAPACRERDDIEDSTPTAPASTCSAARRRIAALPARLGDGVEHAVPALQDQHPRRRPLGAVHRVVAGRRRRRPAASRAPVGARHRRAADAARAHRRRRGPTSATASRSQPLAGHELRAGARRRRRARAPHREQYFEMNGHRGYYRDGWEVVTLHQPLTAVRRPRVGALRPAERPDRAPRPRGRAARAGRRAGRGVGGRRRGRTRCTRSTRAHGSGT